MEKVPKPRLLQLWKELRQRFLDEEKEDLEECTNKIRGDMTFECDPTLSFGEFAMNQIFWLRKHRIARSNHSSDDAEEKEEEPATIDSVFSKTSQELVQKHLVRNSRGGLLISPNISYFTLSSVRHLLKQIRLQQITDPNLVVDEASNLTVGDFSIRYLCNAEFKNYLRNKFKNK